MDFSKIIGESMEKLSEDRPIFHSEADFQFSLALELKSRLGDCGKIRCEYPVDELKLNKNERRPHLDILVTMNGKKIPIELKYKTKEANPEPIKGEKFRLKTQGDQSWNRYDFIKDVWRIERFKKLNKENCDEGYAILLTNDKNLEKDPETSPTLKLTGTLGGGKQYEREYKSEKQEAVPIKLEGSYTANWEDYRRDRDFRYLIVKV